MLSVTADWLVLSVIVICVSSSSKQAMNCHLKESHTTFPRVRTNTSEKTTFEFLFSRALHLIPLVKFILSLQPFIPSVSSCSLVIIFQLHNGLEKEVLFLEHNCSSDLLFRAAALYLL